VSHGSAVARVTPSRGPARSLRLRQAIALSVNPEDLTASELAVYSQNGEDGVLAALLRCLGSGTRFFVEFGVGSGEQANCVLLADHLHWRGVFIERDEHLFRQLERKYRRHRRVQTYREAVSPGNVEAVFSQAGVPARFDVLSIDIDGNDYWVWEALARFRPRITIIEYNGGLMPERRLAMPRDDSHIWDATDYFGASLGAYVKLAAGKGYELVHLEANGVNAFFVAASELRGHARPPIGRTQPPDGGVRLTRDPQRRPFLDLDSGQLVDAPRGS